jgi:hypothetical protein
MPYRPVAKNRKNIGIIYRLTAAVARKYGVRSDGAYAIGAFYTVNIDKGVWALSEGVWYQPIDPEKITRRKISEEDINLFICGIEDGRSFSYGSGTDVSWERIPEEEALQLP